MLESIKAQIIMLAVVPLIGATILGGFSVYETYNNQHRFTEVLPLLDVASKGADFIHELQKERGKSAAMIAGGYKQDAAAKVLDQRAVTDSLADIFVETTLRETAGFEKLNKDAKNLAEDLRNLLKIRETVDGQSTTVAKTVKGYTHFVHDIIRLVAHVSEMSPSEEVTSEMISFLQLVEAKEAGGLERAVGAAMLNETNAGAFKFPRYLNYVIYLGKEGAYLDEFANVASEQLAATFETTVKGADVERVLEIREVLKFLPETKDTQGLQGADWFAIATKRLALIKQVSDIAVSNAQNLAAAEARNLTFLLWELVGFTVALMVFSFGLAIWQLRSITSALSIMAGVVTKLSNGEMPANIPMTQRSDQIGDIARASEVFRDNLIEREKLLASQSEDEAGRRAREERVNALIERFRSEAKNIQETVNANMGLLQGTAGTLITSSEMTSQQSASVATASEEASNNVQTVAAAAEEMAASLGEINRQVSETTRVVGAATEAARTTNEKVSGLSDAAVKIGDVVSLIQDIAEQTNLLALNATIEAARAGDLGKGFAVVASEVKELANQTSKATGEIASQIGSIQSATEESADAIRVISEQMEEVNTYTNGISEAVDQQGIATQEITTNVQLAAQGTQNVARTIVSISDATGETNRSANEASEAANSAIDQSARFNTLVDTFLDEVAAA